MGVGAGRAVRPWKPIEGGGAGRSDCGPMEWRAGARPLRWRRQVAAAPGAGQQPVRVWVPEASERPGEPRRVPGPPACGARPRAETPMEGRGLGRRGGRAAPAAAPRERRRPGGQAQRLAGERRGLPALSRVAQARFRGSRGPRSESRGRGRSHGSGKPCFREGALGCLRTASRGRGSALRAR